MNGAGGAGGGFFWELSLRVQIETGGLLPSDPGAH